MVLAPARAREVLVVPSLQLVRVVVVRRLSRIVVVVEPSCLAVWRILFWLLVESLVPALLAALFLLVGP